MRDSIAQAFVLFLLLCFASSLATAQEPKQVRDWPAGIVPRERLSNERAFDYDFSKISVATLQTWLGRIGIELPVALDGEVSGWVWVQRSELGWLDVGSYRLEGEISSPSLLVDQLKIEDGIVRFGLADGDWYVGEISGLAKSEISGKAVGNAAANVMILASDDPVARVDIEIGSIDIKTFLSLFGIESNVSNRNGRVSVDGVIPISSMLEPATWDATAKVELANVATSYLLSDANLNASFAMEDGSWKIVESLVEMGESELQLSGQGRLSEAFPFEFSLSGDRLNATELLKQLKLSEIASEIEGPLDLFAKIRGNPTEGALNAEAVIKSRRLTISDKSFDQIEAVAAYDSDSIRLTVASLVGLEGEATGTAIWRDFESLAQVVPDKLNSKLMNIQLADLPLEKSLVELSGAATGELQFEKVTQGEMFDWTSAGKVAVEDLRVSELRLGQSELTWDKLAGSAQLNGKVVTSQGAGELTADIRVSLADRVGSGLKSTNVSAYHAAGKLSEYDIFAELPESRSGNLKVAANGEFWLEGSPAALWSRGRFSLQNSGIQIAQRSLAVEFAETAFNEEEIRVERFRLHDGEGRVVGSAQFRRDARGEDRLRLRVVAMSLAPYLKDFSTGKLPSASGILDGTAELKRTAGAQVDGKGWSGKISGSVSELSYHNRPLGNLDFKGNLKDWMLSLNANGTLMSGQTKVVGVIPISTRTINSMFDSASKADRDSAESYKANLELSIEKARVRRIAAMLSGNGKSNLDGSATLSLKLSGGSIEDLEVAGRLDLPTVTNADQPLASDLVSRFKFRDSRLTIDECSGGFAGGELATQGFIELNDDYSGLSNVRFNFATKRMEVPQLVRLIYPEYAKYYEGVLDYRGTASYRRGIQLNGSLLGREGELFGIPIQYARGELRVALDEKGRFSRAISRNLHGTGVGGKFESNVDVRGGSNIELKTNGTISGGKLEQLGKSFGFTGLAGTGKFSSRFNLDSKKIERLDELAGNVQINLEDGDVLSIPLLSKVDRFLPLAQFASTDIENGRLNAIVGQGQLRIRDLVVNSKALVLAATGSASLDGSTLDLDLAVQTGGGIQQQLTQSAVERFIATSIPQLALLNEVNELVRNRSVFLHVGGSTSRPVFSAKPAQTAARGFIETFGRRLIDSGTDSNR